MLISDLHFISKVSNINQLFKIIVAKLSSHFLSQLVCHGLITILVLFMYSNVCFALQEWIQKNGVLSIVLKDNLHQPQVT